MEQGEGWRAKPMIWKWVRKLGQGGAGRVGSQGRVSRAGVQGRAGREGGYGGAGRVVTTKVHHQNVHRRPP